MSDVGDRADAYEARLAAAGSTEALVGSLAANVDRNRRTVRWLAVIVGCLVMLTLAVGASALLALTNANRIETATAIACTRSNDNTDALNDILDTLITNAKASTAYSPSEKAVRIASYESHKRTLIDCT